MHAAVKILLGLFIIALGFALFLDSPSIAFWGDSFTGINWWNNFVIVLTGVIPPVLILLGIFVVWLEADELKAEKEMKIEQEKSEAKNVKSAVKTRKKK